MNVLLLPTECFIGYPVHGQNEIVFEEDVAHDGEEIDEDEGEHGGENDGAAVAGHALYYVEQGFLPVNQIKELRGRAGAGGELSTYQETVCD